MIDSEFRADVVVVGAGIAGALVAERLASKGIDTLIVDAGPEISKSEALERFYNSPIKDYDAAYPIVPYAPQPRTDDPDQYFIQDGPDDFVTSYLRVVGGTTWHWNGISLRFKPDDFKLKSLFGVGVDWPIDYDDLEPWYGLAEDAIGVAGPSSHDLGSPRSTPYPLPPIPLSYLDKQFEAAIADSPYVLTSTPVARNSVPYDGRAACCGANNCYRICPSGAKYDAMVHIRAAQANGARLAAETVVDGIDVSDTGEILALTFKRPNQSTGRIVARTFILAAHGIETPKILLMSRSAQRPNGVANSSDQVGRNLMDHPYKSSWALSDKPVWPFRGPVAISSIEGAQSGPWRGKRPAFRTDVSNAGWVGLGAPMSTVRDLAAQGLSGAALRSALQQHLSRQVGLYSLTEQLPDPSNRIVPDDTAVDSIGIPRPRITYRFDDYTYAGMEAAEAAHEEMFTRLGVSEFHHVKTPDTGTHIMGTYRMGRDPKTSVIDTEMRTHDHPNLFLLGGGAFPTGAAVNPSLTIAALSLRAVDPITSSLTE